MAQNTFALMTNLGRAKEAAALANGTSVVITHIAIGDGTTVPSGGETALYHEVARKAISGHGTVVGASNVAYFDIFLEANEGPYTIREAGLIDQDGDLIAIARYDPPISKPIPSSGQTVEGTIRLEVAFSNVANVVIIVDPSFAVPLQRLSRLPWIPVLSMSVTAPPASPSLGDTYLVPTGATSAWAGQSGKIAEYTAAGWAIITPPDGHGVSLPDGRVFERISGVYVEKLALDVQSGKWSFAVASGSANALSVTLTPTPSALPSMLLVSFTATNTGAATIKINSMAAVPILRVGGGALQPGDLGSGGTGVLALDNANRYQLVSVPVAARSTLSWGTPGTYSFVVPDGVRSIFCRVWGGGGSGGGGSVNNSGGSGAGGGGYAEGWVSVAPGQSITIIVGKGGSPVSGNQLGENGGSSSVGSYMSATGGGGGSWSGNSGGGQGTVGTAGVGVGGSLVLNGQTGGPSMLIGSAVFAGFGGACANGGAGGPILSMGGGGAPGGGGAGSIYGYQSGFGASGLVVIEY